jgi:hypothetical protein
VNLLIRILWLAFVLAALAIASRCNPGPGDADVRGPAKTVAEWPWATR